MQRQIYASLVASLALSACSFLGPSHPATAMVGTVLSVQGAALPSARVSIYSTSFNSNAAGCFKRRVSDALPFTFAVMADGYKPIEAEAKRGFYRVTVVLAPVGSAQASQVQWLAITSSEYDAASCA